MKIVSRAQKKAWRAGWQTALLTQSVIVSDGRRLATGRWRWDCHVPFLTSSATSPKKSCDYHLEHGGEYEHGRWMHVSPGAVSVEWTAAHHSCLPLPLVSARDGNGLRTERSI